MFRGKLTEHQLNILDKFLNASADCIEEYYADGVKEQTIKRMDLWRVRVLFRVYKYMQIQKVKQKKQ